MSLNPSQREAVTTLSGPLLVLAGAGSGKTRVVTYRIAELIKRRTPPQKILAVTFTNKAAKEMQHRAAALLGKQLPQKPEISTFHSLCVRILRRTIQHLGYPPSFAIYDRGDQESVARSALREIRVPEASLRPGDLLFHVSRWKNASIRPEQAASLAETDKEHLAAMAYRRYQRALKLAGAVDFDDLLLCTEELFERFPQARAAEAARFSHLLIDEYQDTNGSQYRIVKALARDHRNLCVVGDDDQSIYGWRGAEVTHILNFQKDWPGAKVVRLEENYRSTEAILATANRLIGFNAKRHDKILRAERLGGEPPRILQHRDETAEAKAIVDEIAAQVNERRAECRDFAILARTNEQLSPFELALRKANLPYVIMGGMSFYDRKEVRDVLAYLKVLTQPNDEVALLRIINTPPRGIGPSSVEALLAHAVAAGKPLWSVLSGGELPGKLTAATVQSIGKFRQLIEAQTQALAKGDLAGGVRRLLDTVNYKAELERQYPEAAEQITRWGAVEEVVNALGAYVEQAERPTLAGFLDEILLSGRDDKDDKEELVQRNAVVLMTLHAAKGLEFPQVYMVGLEENILPHYRSLDLGAAAIDEERRLCYVGITRAKDRLALSLALNRLKWGKLRPTIPSRFLFELTGQAEKAPNQPRGPRQAPAASAKNRPRGAAGKRR